MSLSRPAFRRFWFRRAIAAAALLLQVAVALSPIAEPPAQRPLGAHMEDQGAQHLGLHNESTCLTCAIRAMHSAPAATGDDIRAVVLVGGIAPLGSVLQAAPGSPHTNRSRAPPAQG